MKKILKYQLLFIVFALTGLVAKAQKTDSLYKAKKEKDSVYQALRKEYEAKDSIYHFGRVGKKLHVDSLHYKLRDSVYRKTSKDYRISDSLYHLKNIKRIRSWRSCTWPSAHSLSRSGFMSSKAEMMMAGRTGN